MFCFVLFFFSKERNKLLSVPRFLPNIDRNPCIYDLIEEPVLLKELKKSLTDILDCISNILRLASASASVTITWLTFLRNCSP